MTAATVATTIEVEKPDDLDKLRLRLGKGTRAQAAGDVDVLHVDGYEVANEDGSYDVWKDELPVEFSLSLDEVVAFTQGASAQKARTL